jgi:hypothetical protein
MMTVSEPKGVLNNNSEVEGEERKPQATALGKRSCIQRKCQDPGGREPWV